METELTDFLSPRIVKHCIELYENRHYKHAAHEAMILVEKSLKEKGKVDNLQYGRRLINNLLSSNKELTLRVPLGDDLQEQAKDYFDGVFSYYRNYTAHDGCRIDQITSYRILVIASELLELINSSQLSLTERGGPNEIIKIGSFGNIETLREVLLMLDDYHMPECVYDGLFEDLARHGYGDEQMEHLIDLNLIEMHSAYVEDDPHIGDIIEWFVLGNLGKQFLSDIDTH
jgi:uncharacterized protein (TIGR02391 family)